MTTIKTADHTAIVLSKPFDNRAKILNIIYFLIFSGSAIFIFNMVFYSENHSGGMYLFAIAAVAVYLFAGYRFLNKATQSEKIFVTKTHLTIQLGGALGKQKDVYSVDKIFGLRHLEKPVTTPHPLAGQSTDYLGFQTQQEVINEMHGDKRLAFDYESCVIKFGENIYSWDFDLLEGIFYEITEKDLRRTNDQYDLA